MTSPLIVMISGWAGSGKDAAAALMVEEMGFQREAFADVMKTACAHACHLPLEDFMWPARKDAPLRHPVKEYPEARTPRDILLAYGRRRRAVDDAIFARHVAENIQAAVADIDRFVISDWRFPIEFTELQRTFPSARILRFRVKRSSIRPLTTPTEHLLDDAPFDVIIQNDGCISDLRDALRHALHPYIHRHQSIEISDQVGS
jgi:hypothetical protein